MSGAEVELIVLDLSRRSMPIRNESPPLSPDVHISSPLDELHAQVRSSRNGHSFSALDLRYRSDLYHRVADVWLKTKLRGSVI